jgi:hypothetical protein
LSNYKTSLHATGSLWYVELSRFKINAGLGLAQLSDSRRYRENDYPGSETSQTELELGLLHSIRPVQTVFSKLLTAS